MIELLLINEVRSGEKTITRMVKHNYIYMHIFKGKFTTKWQTIIMKMLLSIAW